VLVSELGGDGWCSLKGGGGDQRAEDVLNPENKHECLFSGLGELGRKQFRNKKMYTCEE